MSSVTKCFIGFVALASATAMAVVVRDSLSVKGLVDHFQDADREWSAVVVARTVGDGRNVFRVRVRYVIAPLTLDPPDPSELQWHFRICSQVTDCSLEALSAPSPPQAADWVFDHPINEDWDVPVEEFPAGNPEAFDVYEALVEVSHLQFALVPGQTYWIVLVPKSRLAVPKTIAGIGITDDWTGESDWFERGANLDGGYGPGPLSGWDENYHYGGYAVEFAHPADFNGDGLVDNADLDIFESCATGPAIPITEAKMEECGKCDLSRDGAVAQDDFGVLQRCFNGSAPPDLLCL